MDTAEQILARNRAAMNALCQHYAVRTLELFGSATTSGFDSQASDFDFLVQFNPPPKDIDLVQQFFDFKEKLEAILGRRVDLVELSAVRNPYFLRAIDRAYFASSKGRSIQMQKNDHDN